MIAGKLIGGALGFAVGGLWLSVLGVALGHLFDRGYSQFQRFSGLNGATVAQVQDTFFGTLFSLLGHLAKADGRVSEEEIQQVELFMVRMGLTPQHRKEAIKFFQLGVDSNFDVETCLQTFRSVCGNRPDLVQMLLVYLIGVALADNRLDDAEQTLLRRVASVLGIPGAIFEQLLRMIQAQSAFSGSEQQASSGDLSLAYQALGVDDSADDREVKRAYRKLMSQFHPDKLMGQGLPEDMIKEATERSQEVQRAYDLIKQSRR